MELGKEAQGSRYELMGGSDRGYERRKPEAVACGDSHEAAS
jgi:hypothetical protein